MIEKEMLTVELKIRITDNKRKKAFFETRELDPFLFREAYTEMNSVMDGMYNEMKYIVVKAYEKMYLEEENRRRIIEGMEIGD